MTPLSPVLIPFILACETPKSEDTGVTTPSEAAWLATLDELEPWMDEWNVPGLGIAIVEEGQITWAGGLGVRARSTGEPVTADTIFKSSSTASKTLVAAALLDQAEDGLIDLDTRIDTWLPQLDLDPDHADDIDLTTLLTMRAGVDAAQYRTSCAGDETMASYFDEESLTWVAPPGDIWLYSAAPAIVGAAVLEAAEGRPWTEVATERILQPIQASGAGFDPTAAVAMDHAVGHHDGTVEEDLDEARHVTCPDFQASAGFLASARDHARLIQAFLGDGPLQSTSLDRLNGSLTAPGFGEPWTYGLQTYSLAYKGEQVVHHYGTNNGYAGGMSWLPTRGFGVVILLNRDASLELTYALEERRWAIIDRFLGLEGDPPDSTTDPTTWAKYDGTYVDPLVPGASLVIETGATGTTARFEPVSSTPAPLVQGSLDAPYQGGDVFNFEDGDHWYLTAFHPSDTGSSDYVVVYTNADLGGQYYFIGQREL